MILSAPLPLMLLIYSFSFSFCVSILALEFQYILTYRFNIRISECTLLLGLLTK